MLLSARHQEVTKLPKGTKIYDGDVMEGNLFLDDVVAAAAAAAVPATASQLQQQAGNEQPPAN